MAEVPSSACLLGCRGSCGTAGTLNPATVTGTIVLCAQDDFYSDDLSGPAAAGAAGMVVPVDFLAASFA